MTWSDLDRVDAESVAHRMRAWAKTIADVPDELIRASDMVTFLLRENAKLRDALMIKEQELADPNSCMNKARPGEMTFVLLARDRQFVPTVRDWMRRRIADGQNDPTDPKMLEAAACADAVELGRFDPVI